MAGAVSEIVDHFLGQYFDLVFWENSTASQMRIIAGNHRLVRSWSSSCGNTPCEPPQ